MEGLPLVRSMTARRESRDSMPTGLLTAGVEQQPRRADDDERYV